MKKFKLEENCFLLKEPHIVEGVIIMPNSPVQIHKINDNNTYDVLYLDREQMPHILTNIKETELSSEKK